MADGDDYEDEPEFTDFFSNRAKFVPKSSAEELQAASKLLEQIQEEKKKDSLSEDTEYVPAKKKGKKSAPSVKQNAFQCVDADIVLLNDDLHISPLPCSTKGRGCRKIQSDPQEELKRNEDLQTSPLSCSKGRGRGRGRGKNQSYCQQELEKVDDLLSSPLLPLSAAAKRRLRKVQRESQNELKRVEAENKKVLSSLNEVENDEIEIEDNEKILTILYLSEISRLRYDEDEKFSTIFQRVADLLHLNVSEFLLCLRNRNIKVDDTPKSLNLTCSDIVECIPYKIQGAESTKYDDNRLQLQFQASDMKQKTEICIHKLETMQDVMNRYSKIRKIPLEQMLFEFDGEKISGTETPQDLDMESGSCIDVTVINVEDKLSRKASNKGNSKTAVIDLTVDGDAYMPDIIFCE